VKTSRIQKQFNYFTETFVMPKVQQAAKVISQRPLWAGGALLGMGLLTGFAVQFSMQQGEVLKLRSLQSQQSQQIELTRKNAQRELNAMSARLAEMQAQATRLNALGKRLVETSGLQGGEFNFDQPVGTGGGGPAFDIPPAVFNQSLNNTQAQLQSTGAQLEVLQNLLSANMSASRFLPSRSPTDSPIITSSFGLRADPFGAGGQFHKGIDFSADYGDSVFAVADGVVSFAGVRTGYGNVIEVDHGNGYVTRYAHNSALSKQVGDLVRKGQEVAKAGSTGRSTGVHVHLEVWKNGAYVNPTPFLQAQRGSDLTHG
jgi:murein DD-endopeptidase MepM/ murein hydrolase activator NlpD